MDMLREHTADDVQPGQRATKMMEMVRMRSKRAIVGSTLVIAMVATLVTVAQAGSEQAHEVVSAWDERHIDTAAVGVNSPRGVVVAPDVGSTFVIGATGADLVR